MKYKCETCGEVFDTDGPIWVNILQSKAYYWHKQCASIESPMGYEEARYSGGGRLIPDVMVSTKPPDPEEIARLHGSADRVGLHIYELQASIDADNEDAQAMATAAIKREVERCRALLGEIEEEYLPGPSDTVGRLRMLKNMLKQGKETEW